MCRGISTGLLFLFLLFLLPSSVESITCRRTGAFGQAVVHESPATDKCYQLTWNTTTTRREAKVIKKSIDFNSVCHNYPEGSIDYRNCRNQAKRFFRDNCYDLEEKHKKTKRPYNEQYRIDMDYFCEAKHLFRP